MTLPHSISSTVDELSATLAAHLIESIDSAATEGRLLIVGIPAGRTLTPVIDALAAQLRETPRDLGHVRLVLMDDYAIPAGDGWTAPPVTAHYSCRQYGEQVIAKLSDAVKPHTGIGVAHLWSPDPADPEAYDGRIADAGGIDIFYVAVGSSDGHVAFNPPGTPLDSRTRIIPLADSTRRDNLGTFPEFASLDDVPTHGVSVGLATLSDARRVEIVVHGAGKAPSAARLLAAEGFHPEFPATFAYEHGDVHVNLDRDAAGLLPEAAADATASAPQ